MAKRVKVYADTLDEFMAQVEHELDEYRQGCESPEDVWLDFGDREVRLMHLNVIIKRFVNPYSGDWLWEER